MHPNETNALSFTNVWLISLPERYQALLNIIDDKISSNGHVTIGYRMVGGHYPVYRSIVSYVLISDKYIWTKTINGRSAGMSLDDVHEIDGDEVSLCGEIGEIVPNPNFSLGA